MDDALAVDLDKQFREELHEFEEQGKMPYVTSIERLGMAEMALTALGEVCDAIPESTANRVRDLSSDQLQQLGKDLMRMKTLADLESWLDQCPSE